MTRLMLYGWWWAATLQAVLAYYTYHHTMRCVGHILIAIGCAGMAQHHFKRLKDLEK